MPLKVSEIKKAINGEDEFRGDSLDIVPYLTESSNVNDGNASVDLRLGRWFLTLKATAEPVLEIKNDGRPAERFATKHFIRFDDRFLLYRRN